MSADANTVTENRFLKINYILWAKPKAANEDAFKVVDTTLEDVAKENNIYNENQRYQPILVITGTGSEFVIEGIADALNDLKVGDTKVIEEIPPEKAYGLRDSRKIETIPTKQLRKEKNQIYKGAVIQYRGRIGRVITTGAGRTVVDFNHPLADHVCKAEVTVVDEIEDDTVKIKELIIHYGRFREDSLKDLKIEFPSESQVDIYLPQTLAFMEGLPLLKLLVANSIRKYLNKTLIRFIDEFTFEEETKEEKEEDKSAVETAPSSETTSDVTENNESMSEEEK